ncbi:uncharacterized protein LOC132735274 [Ruditapes philippinarum]|uniref:uncharacterized protein LOC132735274 n=1 Tax=Ruditapes philippinarum TaxID=129788 RepID=UPI00295A96D6|nr:uncharacterized protein LOC132735274 [Ruditapes philippinarum]
MNETEKDLEDFIQYNIGNFLWIYVSPILIILGTFGNIMSICVLLRPKFRFSTAMFYLTCLSFGDLFTLYTGLLRYWIIKAFDVDVRSFSNASCKIHTFLVYLSLDFTVWVLVTVTIYRFLSVSVPFKAKILCTLKRSGLVIAVIIFLFVVKNIHFFWNMELAGSLEIRCGGKPNDFMKYIWPWIDFSSFCFIPFSIMIACNVKIIYEMTSSQRRLGFFRTPTLAPRLSSPSARDVHSDLNVQSMTMLDTTQTTKMLSQQTLQRKSSLATKLDSPLKRESNSDMNVQSMTMLDTTQTSEMLSQQTLQRTPSLETKLDSLLTRESNSDLTVQSMTMQDAMQTSEMLSQQTLQRTPSLETKLDSPLTRENNSDLTVQSMTMQDATQTSEMLSQQTLQRTPSLETKLDSPLTRENNSDLNVQSMTMPDTTQKSEMLSQQTLQRKSSLATKLDSPLTRESNSDLTVQSMTIQDAKQSSEMLSQEITSQMTSKQKSRQTSKFKNYSPARRISTLTVMLLTVNCVFLITTSPIMVFLIGQEYWYSYETPKDIAWHNFWWALVNMLQYINNSIHFFLYCLTGQRFRKELRVMLRNHKITIIKGTTRRLLVINNVLNHIRLRFSRVLSN